MATRVSHSLLSQVRRAVLAQRLADVPDARLVEAFVACGDEAAFAEIVRRHGTMVMGVCRRVLRDCHDAEDAFQATFLVLIRKADRVRPAMVANWLHGVAYRAALKARAARDRHAIRERQVSRLPEPVTFLPDPWDDVRLVIDQELSRLAEKHRLPIILCDVEGRSVKDAARQLGWPQGTVAGRLARARKTLARRLGKRGLAVSWFAAVAALAREAAAEAVLAAPPVGPGAVRNSAKVAALAQGVLKTMLWNTIKRAAVVPLVLAVLGSGLWTAAARVSAPTAETKATPPPVVAGQDQPTTAPAQGGPVHRTFFLRMYLFDRGARKPGIDFVQVPNPDSKQAKPELVWKKSFHLVNVRDGEQLNKYDIAISRAWATQLGNRRVGFPYETGVNCDLMIKQAGPAQAAGGTSDAEDVALNFCLHNRQVENIENEEEQVIGTSIQVFRKIRLGTPQRIVLVKDDQGRPKTWLEITIIPDYGTHPVHLRIRSIVAAPPPAPVKPAEVVPNFNPVALPKDSRGRPYAAGLEGVWAVTRIEADGRPLGADAIEKFGKTLWCTQGKLVTPGLGLYDLGWEMSFELDPNAEPKRIRLNAKGPTGPLHFNGIYTLDGTDLTISLNENGQDLSFPTEFKTKKGSPFIVFTCKWRGPSP